MGDASISIWVGLVTRNRSASLEKTLISLRKMKSQPDRVVISDDSSDVLEIEKNQAIAERYGCVYYRGLQKGLYANRNFVAQKCLEATHLRTMDDDHTFPEDHWDRCLEAVRRDAKAIWSIGEFHISEKERVRPYPVPGELMPGGYSARPERLDDCRSYSDGGAIIPTDVFKEGNWFSESYRFGLLYLEFGSRLWWKGYRLRVLEDTYLIHDLDLENRSFPNGMETFGAMVFATYCLSFRYQPSLRAKIRTLFEWVRCAGFHLSRWREIKHGVKEGKKHVENLV